MVGDSFKKEERDEEQRLRELLKRKAQEKRQSKEDRDEEQRLRDLLKRKAQEKRQSKEPGAASPNGENPEVSKGTRGSRKENHRSSESRNNRESSDSRNNRESSDNRKNGTSRDNDRDNARRSPVRRSSSGIGNNAGENDKKGDQKPPSSSRKRSRSPDRGRNRAASGPSANGSGDKRGRRGADDRDGSKRLSAGTSSEGGTPQERVGRRSRRNRARRRRRNRQAARQQGQGGPPVLDNRYYGQEMTHYGRGGPAPPGHRGGPYAEGRWERGGPLPPYDNHRRGDWNGGYGPRGGGGYGPSHGPGEDSYRRRDEGAGGGYRRGDGWGDGRDRRDGSAGRGSRIAGGPMENRRGHSRGRSRSFSQSRSRSSGGSSRSRSSSFSRSSRSSSPNRSRSRSRSPSSRGRRGRSRDSSASRSRSRSMPPRSRSRSASPDRNRSRGRNGADRHGRNRLESDSRDRRDRDERTDSGGRDRENGENARSDSSFRNRKHARDKDDEIGESRNKRPSRSQDSDSDDQGDADDKKHNTTSGDKENTEEGDNALTKDQRTVFVSQLVMRAEERDIKRYFRKKAGCKVNDVILLRDRRTGRHKGCAYVELGRLTDVANAVKVSGQVPDFQRFPILVKASEAEKNYSGAQGVVTAMPGVEGSTVLVPTANGMAAITVPGVVPGGAIPGTFPLPTPATVESQASGEKILEAQKVYVGSIDRNVTQAQLYAIFSQFGVLEKVNLQMDPTTGMSRGFAFLSFKDARDANLAIQTMSGQQLAGRPLKTGWANQSSTVPGVEEIVSDEFPEDSGTRIQKALAVLSQLAGSGLVAMPTTDVASSVSAVSQPVIAQPLNAVAPVVKPETSGVSIESVAEAAINAALGVPMIANSDPPKPPVDPDPKVVGGADSPSKTILVHNMFNKDEETEEGWEEEIREDFQEECSKHGKLRAVVVMSNDIGGKIYAAFESSDDAKKCAEALAGRWFDKRQLRVEFVNDESMPNSG